MVSALIQYLIQALLEHMFSSTQLYWKLDSTSSQTFRIYTTYEHLGIQDSNIEISIIADSSEKFFYSITNKTKIYTEEVNNKMFVANQIAQKAKKSFDKFLDDNLYYSYLNYIPVEYSTGFNPVAPTIVFGPFISAGSEMSKEQIDYIASQFTFIKNGLKDGTIVYKRTSRKKKNVEDIDNILSNTETM
jgi:hypothetical protein